MAVSLFAGCRVRDLPTARAWYEQLFGEPAFFPNDVEIVWSVADDRFVYIVEDPPRAGGAVITLFVDDLDARLAALAARGLEPAGREAYANGVRKVTFRDGDGNEVAFAGGPQDG